MKNEMIQLDAAPMGARQRHSLPAIASAEAGDNGNTENGDCPRFLLIMYIAALTVVCAPTGRAEGGQWPIRRVTDNQTHDRMPDISGPNIVWEGWDGNDYEIFLYNGSATIQITNNNTDDLFPAVSGSNIAWVCDTGHGWETFFYNGSITQISNGNSQYEAHPDVWGSNVVWAGQGDIHLWGGATTTNISNSGTASRPAIWESTVVWQASDGNDIEIYLYDGTTTTNISNNSEKDIYPAVSGSNVAWQHKDLLEAEIYLFDGTSTVNISNNSLQDYGPAVWGSVVAWPTDVGGSGDTGFEIFVYDGDAVTRVTENQVYDMAPAVSGLEVVWFGHDGHEYEIWAVTIPGPAPVEVGIDIKPSSHPNSINLLAKGLLPVAILGSDTFDVGEIDQTTLALAGSEALERGKSGNIGAFEDANLDGFIDLMLLFPIRDLKLDPDAVLAELTGDLLDGTPILGSDSVYLLRTGKANLDGFVDIQDFGALKGGFGSGAGVSAVPEPATLSLLGLGCLALIRRTKRSCRA